jgi:hypothetical protein
MWKVAAACVLAALVADAASAQQATPSLISIDSAADIDVTVDDTGNHVTGVFLDSLATVDIGRGFQAMVRPQVQRLPASAVRPAEWNRQIWVADLRYERPGPVAVRVDAGYIPSPIGLANLTLRPQLNPTIAQPAELFTPLPSLERGGPRVNLLSGIYPLGAQATVSAVHWDARVAVVDTSPLRIRRVFASYDRPNPPRFTNVVIGAGVTPFVGFRIGASVTRGGWMRAGESPTTTEDRDATIATVESELSFRHTSLAAEWVHDTLETSLGNRAAGGWYVQGAQALSPRWFVAARLERMNTTLPLPVAVHQYFKASEQTIGFRLTPELTLRASHRLIERFGTTEFDHTGAVSVVWYRRWM